jgi:hypothetical protein
MARCLRCKVATWRNRSRIKSGATITLDKTCQFGYTLQHTAGVEGLRRRPYQPRTTRPAAPTGPPHRSDESRKVRRQAASPSRRVLIVTGPSWTTLMLSLVQPFANRGRPAKPVVPRQTPAAKRRVPPLGVIPHSPAGDAARPLHTDRHPELVSGSILRPRPEAWNARRPQRFAIRAYGLSARWT